eukprot:4519292-Amphidinium_carterae.1
MPVFAVQGIRSSWLHVLRGIVSPRLATSRFVIMPLHTGTLGVNQLLWMTCICDVTCATRYIAHSHWVRSLANKTETEVYADYLVSRWVEVSEQLGVAEIATLRELPAIVLQDTAAFGLCAQHIGPRSFPLSPLPSALHSSIVALRETHQSARRRCSTRIPCAQCHWRFPSCVAGLQVRSENHPKSYTLLVWIQPWCSSSPLRCTGPVPTGLSRIAKL